jgi:ACR3 family arsenite efflux pump ArsB
MIATALTQFGVNSEAIWTFAAGVLAALFVLVIIVTAIEFIKSLIDGGG